ALASAKVGELLADGELRLRVELGAGDAGLQHMRLQAEEAAVVAVAHQKPALAVPEHEGLRDALDGVAQAGLGGLGAGLGQALLGDVERDADDPRIAALGALAEGLAARVDPHRPAAGLAGDAERDVEAAVDRGCAQRLAKSATVAFG